MTNINDFITAHAKMWTYILSKSPQCVSVGNGLISITCNNIVCSYDANDITLIEQSLP